MIVTKAEDQVFWTPSKLINTSEIEPALESACKRNFKVSSVKGFLFEKDEY